MPAGHDVPLLRGTFTIRSPRSVLLLYPFQLTIVVAILAVSVTFTFWPEALEHAPVSFEQRGVIHHVWHYALLAGSGGTLWGMLSASALRLKVELIGLCLLVGALAMNLATMVADALASTSLESSGLSGLEVALRAGVIAGLVVRAFTVTVEPTVELVNNQTEGLT